MPGCTRSALIPASSTSNFLDLVIPWTTLAKVRGQNIFKKSLTRLQGRCQVAPDLLHFLATATCEFLDRSTVHGWLKLMWRAFLAASLCSVSSSELFWSRHAGHRPQSRDRSRFIIRVGHEFFSRICLI